LAVWQQKRSQPVVPCPKLQAGFTLLEVMIALAIVAVALVALLGLETRSIEVSARQQILTRATLLAQERLAEIESAATVDAAETSGVFAPPFAEFRWQVQFVATPLPQVRQVEMTVAWGESKRNEEVTLTSFVWRPAAAP